MIEKYTDVGIIICSFSILSLIFLIVRAYIRQHPIFSFIQGDLFKSEMTVIASIAQALLLMGTLFLLLTFLLFFWFNYQWHQFLWILILACLFSIITSFVFLFKSYNWQISYLKYRYIGLLTAVISGIGQFLKVEFKILATAHKIELSKNIILLFNFPFHIFLLVGFIILTFSFPSANK